MRSSRRGGTGSFPTALMSKAGRSARAITSTRIWQRSGSIIKRPTTKNEDGGEKPMDLQRPLAAGLAAALSFALPASAEETPKRGGTLTYLVPADAPPSFDGHREATYATVHTAAPYYSVLIQIGRAHV